MTKKTFGAPHPKKGGRAAGGPDKRVFSEEGNARRMHALRHNQLSGYAALIKKNIYTIGIAPSTTVDAKRIAAEIYKLTLQLEVALKTRVDP
jgi:hypothetical protein